jgi:hypothetical protein
VALIGDALSVVRLPLHTNRRCIEIERVGLPLRTNQRCIEIERVTDLIDV